MRDRDSVWIDTQNPAHSFVLNDLERMVFVIFFFLFQWRGKFCGPTPVNTR